MDDSSVLLRRQLSDCETALHRHTAAVAALELAAQPPPASADCHIGLQTCNGSDGSSSIWIVAAGENAQPSAVDPNPPRLWLDLRSFGARGNGVADDSVVLSACLHAATIGGRGGATIFIPAAFCYM